jgi:hypothetical protein
MTVTTAGFGPHCGLSADYRAGRKWIYKRAYRNNKIPIPVLKADIAALIAATPDRRT